MNWRTSEMFRDGVDDIRWLCGSILHSVRRPRARTVGKGFEQVLVL